MAVGGSVRKKRRSIGQVPVSLQHKYENALQWSVTTAGSVHLHWLQTNFCLLRFQLFSRLGSTASPRYGAVGPISPTHLCLQCQVSVQCCCGNERCQGKLCWLFSHSSCSCTEYYFKRPQGRLCIGNHLTLMSAGCKLKHKLFLIYCTLYGPSILYRYRIVNLIFFFYILNIYIFSETLLSICKIFFSSPSLKNSQWYKRIYTISSCLTQKYNIASRQKKNYDVEKSCCLK